MVDKEKSRKFCNNKACGLFSQKVETALTECIGCHRDLVRDNPLGGLGGRGGLFDENFLRDFLGGKL